MKRSILKALFCLTVLTVGLESCIFTSKSRKSTKKSKKSSVRKLSKAVPTTPPSAGEQTLAIEQEAPKLAPQPEEKTAYIDRYGTPEVSFVENDNGLHVMIETKNLVLTSVTMKDLRHYTELFGNAQVMQHYAEGKPRSKVAVKKMLTTWTQRWEAKNPFSGLVVRKKAAAHQLQGEFLGHIVLGLSPEKANTAELAGLMVQDAQHNGYGYEAAGALALFYAHELVQLGYKLPSETSVERILATAKPENKPVLKILKALGFKICGEGKPYGDGATRTYNELIINS